MEYRTIFTIKETVKATVELADVEGMSIPVVVKHLRGANPDIYRLLCYTQNSHIPLVYVCEQQGDELIVAEEYVDGENLADYMKKQQPGNGAKLELALQLCEAVEFLHSQVPPILHRDIKPSNIVITGKGILKLIDFDASRQYKGIQNNEDTRLLGTRGYAAPEQFGYAQTDVRSDIYSMGIVLHEMKPADDKKLEEQWDKIAEKCTSFDPKNRYQDVQELAKEIRKLRDRKKLWWKKFAIGCAAGVTMLAIAVAAIIGLGNRQERETSGNIAQLTDTPVPTSTPTSTPTLVPTLAPTLAQTPVPTSAPTMALTPTIVPTLSPEPTATETPVPSPTPTATPSPMPTATPSPMPTATPSPMPTPTPSPTATATPASTPTATPNPSLLIAPTPTMSPKMKQLYAVMPKPPASLSSMYKFYKSQAEQTEVVYDNNDVVGLQVEYLGGICYNYQTGEETYIPPEMIDGGPTYCRVADEFLLELEPGLYHVYISRETETGRMGNFGRSLEIYPEEKTAPKPQNLLTEVTRTFYSGYQRNVDFILLSDVTARFESLYLNYKDKAPELLDASCYEIIMDGKVLLLKKEFLISHMDDAALEFMVVLDDGQTKNVKVELIKGVHPKITSTPTPTLVLSITPTPTPEVGIIPTKINQHYYKGMAKETELILLHGSDTAKLPETWLAECYDYVAGKIYTIPMEEIEIGPGYIRFLDEGLEQLEPSLYNLTVTMYFDNHSWKQSTSRVLKVYGEEELFVSSSHPMTTSVNYFYRSDPHDFLRDISSRFPGKFTGVWMESEGGQQVEVAPEWYTMYCEDKVLILKKEFLLQYYEEGQQFKLIYYFDDGQQQTAVINFEESR